MFLDADAIIIIVMDISKPLKEKLNKDKDAVEAVPQTPEDFLCYWLRSIQAKASEKNVEANILLVLTHKDTISGSQPSSYIKDFVHNVQQVISQNNLHLVDEQNIYIVDNNTRYEDHFQKISQACCK